MSSKKIALVDFSFILFKAIHSYYLSRAFLGNFIIDHLKVISQNEEERGRLSVLILKRIT